MADTIETVPTLEQRAVSTEALSVELLYFDGCPTYKPALVMLQDVLAEEGAAVSVHLRQITSDEEAEALSFPGSPTIRVAGTDVDEHRELPVGLSCRTYRQADGSVSPLPPREKIAAAVRRVLEMSSALPPAIGG